MRYLQILFLLGLFGCSSKEPTQEVTNYDDCILNSIKGASTQQAVTLVNSACTSKFLARNQKDEPLPKEVLERIHGQGSYPVSELGVEFTKIAPTFHASIFNSNDEYVITQLTIEFMKKTKVTNGDSKIELREPKYNVDVKVKPLTSGFFEFSILPGNFDDAWSVVAGRGYKINQ